MIRGTNSNAPEPGNDAGRMQGHCTTIPKEIFLRLCQDVAFLKGSAEVKMRTVLEKVKSLEIWKSRREYLDNLLEGTEFHEIKRMIEDITDRVERANPWQMDLHKAKLFWYTASPEISEATTKQANHAKELYAKYEPTARQPTVTDNAAEFILEEVDTIYNSVLATYDVIRANSMSPFPIEKLVLRVNGCPM